MISGKYKISMQMPDRVEKGIVTFNEFDGKLSGTLEAGNIFSRFSGGRTDGNKFEFTGVIRKLIFKIQFTARGEVRGNTLTAVAETKHGSFSITGTRI